MMDYTYLLIFLFGVLIGWLTKVPWLRKWYKEFEAERVTNERFRKRLFERDSPKT